MEYTLQIENLGNLPPDFELYLYEGDVLQDIDLLSGNTTSEKQLKINEDNIHKYQLKIKWRDGENSYLYNKTIDYVRIILNSKQID